MMRRSLLSGLIGLLITGCSEPERITPGTAVSACGAAHPAQVALDKFLADQTLDACLQYAGGKVQKVSLVDGILGTYEVPSDEEGDVRLWVMAAGESSNCKDLKWPNVTDLSCGSACGCSGAWCLEYSLEPKKQIASLTKILQRSVETFNCQDDDCDGKIDEGLPSNNPCMTGLPGVCAPGVGICEVGDRLVCTPTIEPGTQPEVCNGRDDDCDGEPDNVPGMGDPCVVGVGACTESGQKVCGEMADLICDAVAGPVMAETCNQIDDDCDGNADEGLAGCCENGELRACGLAIGECQPGSQRCIEGEWGACEGGRGRADEICNGRDDDCDGNTDNGARCEPVNHAVVQCVDGGCRGRCEPGYVNLNRDGADGCECEVQNESCNGQDDDCDGTLDEDVLCAPVANADVVCRQATCQATCSPGFQDLNEDLADGCEARIPPDAGPDAGSIDAGM